MFHVGFLCRHGITPVSPFLPKHGFPTLKLHYTRELTTVVSVNCVWIPENKLSTHWFNITLLNFIEMVQSVWLDKILWWISRARTMPTWWCIDLWCGGPYVCWQKAYFGLCSVHRCMVSCSEHWTYSSISYGLLYSYDFWQRMGWTLQKTKNVGRHKKLFEDAQLVSSNTGRS